MRKFVSLVLIVCVLILVGQTCEELFPVSGGMPALAANSKVFHTQSRDTSDMTDDCSPFCICSCRQISSLEVNHIGLPEHDVDQISSHEIPTYGISPHHSSFNKSIWQPPKA